MGVLPISVGAALLLALVPVSVFCQESSVKTVPAESETTVTRATKHTCSLTGDPHLRTFLGNKVSVPHPCLYLVMKVDNFRNEDDGDVKTEVEIKATNDVIAATGQYFVSKVIVAVTLYPGEVKEDAPDRTHTVYETSYARFHAFLKGTYDDVWAMTTGDSLPTVSGTYNSSLEAAILTIDIPSNDSNAKESVRVQFRPADHERAEAGQRQLLTAGITIEVEGEDMISEDQAFPNTMCSQVTNATRTPRAYAKLQGLPPASIGIYAALMQNLGSDGGSHGYQCYTTMTFSGRCQVYGFPKAVAQCYPLLTRPSLVSCIETNTTYSAMQTFQLCLQYYCKIGPDVCGFLKEVAAACPSDLPVYSCQQRE